MGRGREGGREMGGGRKEGGRGRKEMGGGREGGREGGRLTVLGFYVMLQQRGSQKLGYADYQFLIIIKETKAHIRMYMQDKESRL